MKVWVVRTYHDGYSIALDDRCPSPSYDDYGFGFELHANDYTGPISKLCRAFFGDLPIGVPKQFELTAKEVKE